MLLLCCSEVQVGRNPLADAAQAALEGLANKERAWVGGGRTSAPYRLRLHVSPEGRGAREMLA